MVGGGHLKAALQSCPSPATPLHPFWGRENLQLLLSPVQSPQQAQRLALRTFLHSSACSPWGQDRQWTQWLCAPRPPPLSASSPPPEAMGASPPTWQVRGPSQVSSESWLHSSPGSNTEQSSLPPCPHLHILGPQGAKANFLSPSTFSSVKHLAAVTPGLQDGRGSSRPTKLCRSPQLPV